MSIIKSHKNKIITVVLAILVLAAVLFFGIKYKSKTQDSYAESTQGLSLTETALKPTPVPASEIPSTPVPTAKSPEREELPETTPDVSITPAPTPSLPPKIPEQELELASGSETDNGYASADKENLYCSLLISCNILTENLMLLPPEKRSIVPADGIIFSSEKVVFYEGESVFNVLSREMKKNKIHLEFVHTPVYDSVYIEGIANLYQFDAGELSGWIYRVNGKIPSLGCSLHTLENGDRVEFIYTCDLGDDVGGY